MVLIVTTIYSKAGTVAYNSHINAIESGDDHICDSEPRCSAEEAEAERNLIIRCYLERSLRKQKEKKQAKVYKGQFNKAI
jgi:hypothetical protein